MTSRCVDSSAPKGIQSDRSLRRRGRVLLKGTYSWYAFNHMVFRYIMGAVVFLTVVCVAPILAHRNVGSHLPQLQSSSSAKAAANVDPPDALTNQDAISASAMIGRGPLKANSAHVRITSASSSVSDTNITCSSNCAPATLADASMEYSWRQYDVPPELGRAMRVQLTTCMANAADPHGCNAFSQCTTTPEQCLYAEASAWDEIGAAAYDALLRVVQPTAALIDSQTSWKNFARAECRLTSYLFQDDPVLRREEIARCAVRLSSERAIDLHQYLANVTK